MLYYFSTKMIAMECLGSSHTHNINILSTKKREKILTLNSSSVIEKELWNHFIKIDNQNEKGSRKRERKIDQLFASTFLRSKTLIWQLE